ncbi:4'-phosphopantetheinyl transferase superfamily protein [Candidatus Kaiserbacteria bacterium]|nr:4'-phosphopantetheinyl transferase superfamily protein [Candidatus Kaiserbacteria bacterium]
MTDSARHLAGTFAAKEAVRKTFGDKSALISSFEIQREKSGKPSVWIKGKRSRKISISITHTAKITCAMAFETS